MSHQQLFYAGWSTLSVPFLAEELTEIIEEEEEEVSLETDLEEKLNKSIEELELSVRSYNCLEAAGIKTIRDLVQKSEPEMLKYRNFGRKSLSEIKNSLKDMHLSFNMNLEELGISSQLNRLDENEEETEISKEDES